MESLHGPGAGRGEGEGKKQARCRLCFTASVFSSRLLDGIFICPSFKGGEPLSIENTHFAGQVFNLLWQQ